MVTVRRGLWTLVTVLVLFAFPGCEKPRPGQGFDLNALPDPHYPLCYANIDRDTYSDHPVREEMQRLFVGARQEMYGGHLDTALARLNAVEPLMASIPKAERRQWRSSLYTHKAWLHTRRKELPVARAFANRAILASEGIDSSQMLEAYVALANVEYQLTEFNKALRTTDYAGQNLLKFGTSRNQLDAYYLIRGNSLKYHLADSAVQQSSGREWHTFLKDYKTHCDDRKGCDAAYHKLVGTALYVAYVNSQREPDSLESTVRHIQTAIDLWESMECPDNIALAEAYELMSDLKDRQGLSDEAIAMCDSALRVLNGRDMRIDHLARDQINVQLVNSKAYAMQAKAVATSDSVLSRDAYKLFLKVDTLLSRFTKYDRDTYLHFNFYNDFVYQLLVKYCYQWYSDSGDPKWLVNMLGYIDEYRSKSLRRDQALQRLYSMPDLAGDKLIQQIAENDIHLEELNHLLSAREHPDTELYASICKAIERQHDLFRSFAARHPELYSRTVFPRTEINGIIEASKTDSIARVYYYKGSTWYNKEIVYCLTIFNGNIRLIPVEEELQPLIARIDTLARWHENRRVHIPPAPVYSRLSNGLFNTLLKPIWADLQSAKSVRIVPDQELTELVFGALVVEHDTSATRYAQLDYLTRHLPVSYSYTIDEPESIGFDNEADALQVLAMAWSNETTIAGNDVPTHMELLSSIIEIDAIRNKLADHDCHLFTGEQCTRKNFERYAPTADILHLSIHGSSVGRERLDSKLYFRGRHGRATPMYTYELMYKDIDPDLVVLSACETGAGLLQGEEGMFSVGRSFIIAGARNVISSNWLLSDRVAGEVFETFYSHYPAIGAAEALSQAQVLFIDRAAHPYDFPGYWAPLVVYN